MGFEIVKENSPGFTNWENSGSSFLLKNKVKDMTKYELHPLRQLKNRILQANPLKVVIGGGDIMHDASWIVTNQEEIDAELKDDFEYFFESKNADNFFASHVFEHLKDVESAVINLYNSLKIGGKLRIAVPDGYFPDEKYINEVKVGGMGAGSDDHKYLFNIDSLSEILTKYGFKVEPIEYWKDGKFYKKDWSANDGFVGRSAEFDERNINGELKYTSLIIDAIK